MFYIVAFAWLVLDQITKYFVQTHMSLGESIPVIPGFFHWTYIINHGAAFGILRDQRWFFLAIVLILLGVAYYYRHHILKGPGYLKVGAALLLSGAIGNAIDRFLYHGVVDFFDFRVWPIFNVADIGICLGILMVAYYLIKEDAEEAE